MPRLVKGGKWVYGISITSSDGCIAVPADALEEYGFIPGDGLVAMSASRTSGGFILTDERLLSQTVFTDIIRAASGIYGIPGAVVNVGRRWLAGTVITPLNCVSLPGKCLSYFGIQSGDRLAVVRGSRSGLSFLAKGPILEETKKHPELPVYYGV